MIVNTLALDIKHIMTTVVDIIDLGVKALGTEWLL